MLGISMVLSFIQSNTSGVNIFLVSYLIGDVFFKVIGVMQFLITPLILS